MHYRTSPWPVLRQSFLSHPAGATFIHFEGRASADDALNRGSSDRLRVAADGLLCGGGWGQESRKGATLPTWREWNEECQCAVANLYKRRSETLHQGVRVTFEDMQAVR